MNETKLPIKKEKTTFSDLISYIENLFWVETKDGEIVPFILNKKQRQLIADIKKSIVHYRKNNKPVRVMILKGRQFGISTIIVALFFIKCLVVPNTRAVVISHEEDATKRLFRKVKFFAKTLGIQIDLDKESEKEYSFPKTNSWFYIGTAGARAFGRGDNITDLHCSEVAFWKGAAKIMNGLLQAVGKSGRVFIECTANGMGGDGAYLYRIWKRSWQKAGSAWNALFYSWTDFDEYEMELLAGFTRTDDEKHLVKLYLSDMSESKANRKLAWRRWKIDETEPDAGLTPEQIFQQEYPFTPEEAFIASGNCIFNTSQLLAYETEPGEQEDGWTWWGKAETTETYMGIDVAEGVTLEDSIDVDDDVERKTYRDNHAIEIFDGNLNQIGEYISQCDIDELALEAVTVAKRLGCFIGFEVNNHGIALAAAFKRLSKDLKQGLSLNRFYHREVYDENYKKITKKLGWRTDAKTKPLMLNEAVALVRTHQVGFKSYELVQESLATVRDENGKIDTQGKDRLMAAAIAIQMHKFKPPRVDKLTPEQKTQQNKEKLWKLKQRTRALKRHRGGQTTKRYV